MGDTSAKTFGEAFYQQIVSGESLGTAMGEGRKRVENLQSVDRADYILYASRDFVIKVQ